MERIDLDKIRWTDDDTDSQYSKGLRRCKNLEELTEFLEAWEPLAADALEVVRGFCEKDVHEFIGAMKNDTDKTPITDEGHLKIVFPDVLFTVSVKRVEFKVPWGAMFRRMQTVGIIVVEDGVARRLKGADDGDKK